MDRVSMFRCKQCGVRLFERDCAGHLARHGVDVAKLSEAKVLERFEKGEPTAFARPGDSSKGTFYQVGKGRPKKGQQRPSVEPDDDDPIDILDELN